MTPAQISNLVAFGESEQLEFKSSTFEREHATQTICAMLNQGGGRVLFGVYPDSSIQGQPVSDNTIQKLSAEIQLIDPPVFPEVERIPLSKDMEIISIHVQPGPIPPYQYQGVSFQRVGSTTRCMPAEEYNRILFERMHSNQRWENQPALGWKIDDLDLDEIRNTIAEAVRIRRLAEPGSRQPEDLLRVLGLMDEGVLRRAAVVLFGQSERLESDMPQCLLRVARFRGLDRSEFLDNRQFISNAFSLLRHAERFLRETLPIASRFVPGQIQRIDEPHYPPLATREAIANTLCHRDYSIGGGSIGLAVYDDRLEVSSPGLLHFGLTPEDLFGPHESKLWNPMIARTFYRCGVIEHWGRGTNKMAELAIEAGMPHPSIEQHGDCTTVCFYRADEKSISRPDATTTDLEETILELLHESESGLATREILSKLGEQQNKPQLRTCLRRLRAKGYVEPIGHGRGARWKAIDRRGSLP